MRNVLAMYLLQPFTVLLETGSTVKGGYSAIIVEDVWTKDIFYIFSPVAVVGLTLVGGDIFTLYSL